MLHDIALGLLLSPLLLGWIIGNGFVCGLLTIPVAILFFFGGAQMILVALGLFYLIWTPHFVVHWKDYMRSWQS